MFCRKCGNPLKEGERFCGKCGTPVAKSDPGQPSGSNPPAGPAPAKVAPEKPAKPKKTRAPMKKSTKALLIAAAVVLLLGALAVAGAVALKNSPAYEAVKLFDEGKTQPALSVYYREIQDNKLQGMMFSSLINKQWDKKLKDYDEGKLSLDDIQRYAYSTLPIEALKDSRGKLSELISKKTDAIVSACAEGAKAPLEAMQELEAFMKCERHCLDSHYSEEKLKELITKTANAAVDGFLADTVEYEKAKAELTELIGVEKRDELGGYAAEKLAKLNSLYSSENAYNSAEEFLGQQMYEKAIEAYGRVDEDSPLYSDAQSKLEATRVEYRASVLSSAESKKKAGDYKGALSLLESALKVLPGDEQLMNKIDDYTAEYYAKVASEALSEAKKLRSNGKYADAITEIRKALSTVGENTELSALLDQCADDYVKEVTKKINKVVDDDWDEAKKLINAALQLLPANSELNELKRTVEDKKPVELVDLPILDQEWAGFAINNEFYDTYDNKYKSTCSFNNSYVIFNLNKQYRKLEFIVAPCKGFIDSWTDPDGHPLKIYCDDKLVYSTMIKKLTRPEKVTLDVSGTSLLKIESPCTYRGTYQILVADGILKK